MLSREWRRSWSSADRRCYNYIWVINNFIAFLGASNIRGLTSMCTYRLYYQLLIAPSWCPPIYNQCNISADFFSMWKKRNWDKHSMFPTEILKEYIKIITWTIIWNYHFCLWWSQWRKIFHMLRVISLCNEACYFNTFTDFKNCAFEISATFPIGQWVIKTGSEGPFSFVLHKHVSMAVNLIQ